MRHFTTTLLLLLSTGMAGCERTTPTGVSDPDELGDVTVGDVTVPYVAIEMAAEFVGLPVAQVWTMMYESAVLYGSDPQTIVGVTADMTHAARILDQTGFQIPVETEDLEGVLVLASDEGHMCTLMNYRGSWDDEDAVEYWKEHHLFPWGACVDAIKEHEGCTDETLEKTTSKDDEGRTFLHVWCDPEPH